MTVRRPRALLLAGLSLLAGLLAGLRLAPRLEPATAAAGREATGWAAPSTAFGPDFSAIARRATPAVVNISALQVFRTERSPFFSDPFFQEFFGRDLPFRVPREERRTSLGSGVLVAGDGLIVTNNHVIDRAQQVIVTTADHRRFQARVLGADAVTDIAVVKIEGRGLPTLAWGDSARADVGEYVVAIGNPFRLSQTVTMGIISAKGRSNVGIVDYEDFIQTDAAINPGNSGGALVNVRGELIGINTAIYSETGGYQGIGFAVPSNLARQVVEQLGIHGRVVRGWVGITRIADVAEDGEQEGPGGDASGGALVVELLRDSPADRAGLEPGDVVVEVEGRAVENAAQLRNELARAEVGSRLRLTVLREERRRVLHIRVEEAGPGGA